MNNPLITIIIPVYNGRKYMKEAIDSALAQTYSPLEIVVVNDGATDNGATRKIALSYGNKIRYFEKENGGVSTALNYGIKEMKGEYFSWLSHDDAYYPNKIAEEYKFFKTLKDSKAVVYSDFDLMDERSKITSVVKLDHERCEKYPNLCLIEGTLNGLTLFMKKKAFDDAGLFNEKLRCTQDYVKWLEMIKAGYTFYHCPQVLVTSRQHAEQVTYTSPKMLIEGNALYRDLIDELEDESLNPYFKTQYAYYKYLVTILSDSPYKEAYNYAEKKMNSILSKKSKVIRQSKTSIITFIDKNNYKNLSKSIDSIKNQTINNFELIIISNDKTLNIESFIKGLKNVDINYTVKEKFGKSELFNEALKKAKGIYITFLEIGDEYKNNFFEYSLRELVLEESDVCFSNFLVEDAYIVNNGSFVTGKFTEFMLTFPFAISGILIKKSFILKNDIKFNEDLTIENDRLFFLKVLRDANISHVNEILLKITKEHRDRAYDMNEYYETLKSILYYVLIDKELSNNNVLLNEITRYMSEMYNKISSKIDNHTDYLCPNCLKLMNSTSWKVTSPLRRMKEIRYKIRNKGLVGTLKAIVKRIKK